jgi:LysM repeat protein
VACYEQSFEQHLFDSLSRKDIAMAVTVVIPGSWAEPRWRHTASATQIYARRRLIAAIFAAAIALVVLVGGGHVVANRGSAPASALTVRPASSAVDGQGDAHAYVVQPGDTLWSIGERFHGQAPLADYVDALVAANGGSEVLVAQSLTLP